MDGSSERRCSPDVLHSIWLEDAVCTVCISADADKDPIAGATNGRDHDGQGRVT